MTTAEGGDAVPAPASGDPAVSADAGPTDAGPRLGTTVLLVGVGGAIGTALRALAVPAGGAAACGVLVATAVVNLLGALALGGLVGALDGRPRAAGLRLAVGVGLLGSLTTWSALAVQVVLLLRNGQLAAALGYGLGSVAGGLCLAALGLRLGLRGRAR